ncbi:endo alpha-1,4 polygalactosaminidase [Streptomyces sp. NPDC096040]|uniref:endo alpha-1,4 polygalactosaminidase n=1 Tax=Streptomyces sp. NPDC096040 TaxID=3155541 RepID=UPI003333D3F0
MSACSSATSASAATVTLPPTHVGWDYQINRGYTPPADAKVVSRDHDEEPAAGLYNICYINAFQAQKGAEGDWDDDLLLRDSGGNIVYDQSWDEAVLDIRTDAKRKRIAAKVDTWIDECAAKGFNAVEPDNYGTFTRFGDYLNADHAKAFMKLLSAYAHGKGLAIAQKNTLEFASDRTSVGLDFAVVEERGRWKECGEFADAFANNVLVVEYTATGLSQACSGWGSTLSIVRRDPEVLPKGESGYLRKTC